MSSEWPARKIGDIGRVVTGKTPSTSEAQNFGGPYPFITIPDLGQRREVTSTERSVSELGAKTLGNCKLPAGAVLMSCIATVGKTGITTQPSFTNQQINAVVCGREVLPTYLYYVFRELGSELEAAGGGGSVYTNVSKSRFSSIEICVPPMPVQAEIASVLSALDDRITLLRETNATLETVAHTLFKSWFVDFEPVRVKLNGGVPPGIHEDTAALFPDEFEESNLGPIPKGWTCTAVYDLANFINGAAYKAFEPNAALKGLPIVKIAELKAGVTGQTAYSDMPMPEKYRIETGDILFSWSGNPDTSIDTFVWAYNPAWLNQHIFRVLPHVASERAFILQMLRHLRPTFTRLARNKQTTGLGHVTVGDLKALLIAKPDPRLLTAFASVAGPIQERVLQNHFHINTLAVLRDGLLPRLLSGQLSPDDAKQFAEAA
jgi:type I restriction enzyme, S subunit